MPLTAYQALYQWGYKLNQRALFVIAAILLALIPIAYSGMEVGGSLGIDIAVVSNASDDVNATIDGAGISGHADDGNHADDIPNVDIYYRSYARFQGEILRQDNYAFTGEEVVFEIYVTKESQLDEVVIEKEDGTQEKCHKAIPEIANGDSVPSGFSENITYHSNDYEYYECSFIVDDQDYGDNLNILALNKDDKKMGRKREFWRLNPEITSSYRQLSVENAIVSTLTELDLNVDYCGMTTLLKPYKEEVIVTQQCSQDELVVFWIK